MDELGGAKTPPAPKLGASAAHQVHDQRDQEQHHEDIEQQLGDADRRTGDRGETQYAGDEGDHEDASFARLGYKRTKL